jgi:hypothetical protein
MAFCSVHVLRRWDSHVRRHLAARAHGHQSVSSQVVEDADAQHLRRALISALSTRRSTRTHKPIGPRTSTKHLIDEIDDLVRNEAATAAMAATFNTEALHLSKDPKYHTSKLLSHFQRLFDIRSFEGILPKMNEIYLFVNEIRPSLKAMRHMLRLGS